VTLSATLLEHLLAFLVVTFRNFAHC
jgi:hypothetical protein